MGLNLKRERFIDWLAGYGTDSRTALLAKLERHVGRPIDVDAWQVEDDAYPKVGSYTSYGVFRDCLYFLAVGDDDSGLTEADDIEREALEEFRRRLPAGSLNVPQASHFLSTGDSDTIFIPLPFDTPFAFDDRYVASLPGALSALETFAKGLGFDLNSGPDPEFEDGRWLAVATARNIARKLYGFFSEKQGACVMFA